MIYMKKISIFFLIFISLFSKSLSDEKTNFDNWKKNFKIRALSNNISEETIDMVLSGVVFLPKVIEYDRFQPEFYEDTKTYITKRASKKKDYEWFKFIHHKPAIHNLTNGRDHNQYLYPNKTGDAVYLGELSRFLCVSVEPKTQFD